MTGNLYSAAQLMALTGCESERAFRAWLRKHGIKAIPAPAGPIVPHEAILDALGLNQAQNSSAGEYGADIFSAR